MDSYFSQDGYRCKLEWGRRGAQAAAERGDILVIVDALRFSTTVATAVHHGACIYPCLETEEVASIAAGFGLTPDDLASHSLSPCTFFTVTPGTRIPLASLNGAVCSRYGRTAPHTFVAAVVNASATAAAVNVLLNDTKLNVTIIACGERWKSRPEDGTLRMAVEDYLGAGAILAGTTGEKSPEAVVCEASFTACRSRLTEIIWDCGSGRELRGRNQGDDVLHAAKLDLYNCVAVLRDGYLINENR